MPPTDQRSVEEILLNADLTARDMLLRIDPDQAPGMVRAWPAVTQAAEALWDAFPAGRDARFAAQDLPPAPMREAVDQMTAQARSMVERRGRSTSGGTERVSPWPAPGGLDDRMIRIGQDLMRAADLIGRHARGRHGATNWTSHQNEDLAAAAARGMHALYVTAHATAITCEEFAANVRAQNHPHDTRALRPAIRAEQVARLLRVTEDLAGDTLALDSIGARAPGRAAPAPGAARLHAAVGDWNRATATLSDGTLTAGQLRWAAHVETVLAAGTAVIAAAKNHVDQQEQPAELAAALRDTHRQWGQLRDVCGQLSDAGDRPPVEQVKAGNELIAALRELTWDHNHAATPETIAARADLAEAMHALDVGHGHARMLADDVITAAAEHRVIAHARPLYQAHTAAQGNLPAEGRSQTLGVAVPMRSLNRNSYLRVRLGQSATIESHGEALVRACDHTAAVLQRQSTIAGRGTLIAERLGTDSPAAARARASQITDLLTTVNQTPAKDAQQSIADARQSTAKGRKRTAQLMKQIERHAGNHRDGAKADPRRDLRGPERGPSVHN